MIDLGDLELLEESYPPRVALIATPLTIMQPQR